MSSSEINHSDEINHSEDSLTSPSLKGSENNDLEEITSPRRWILWIGLGVVGLLLLFIFKTFLLHYFSDSPKETPVLAAETSKILDEKRNINQLSSPNPEPSIATAEVANSLKTSSNAPAVPLMTSPISQGSQSLPPMASENASVNSSAEITPDPQTLEANQVRILALENKVQELERRLQEEENQKIRKAQIWLKFQQLQTALDVSKNFEVELDQFSALISPQAKIMEPLNFIRPFAKTGFLTADQLGENFTLVRQEIMAKLNQKTDLWQKLRLYFMPWIRIYNTRNMKTSSINLWTLQQLEKAVAAKDFDQITQILASLQDSFEALNLWRKQIQDYQHLKQIKQNLLTDTILEIVQPSPVLK